MNEDELKIKLKELDVLQENDGYKYVKEETAYKKARILYSSGNPELRNTKILKYFYDNDELRHIRIYVIETQINTDGSINLVIRLLDSYNY